MTPAGRSGTRQLADARRLLLACVLLTGTAPALAAQLTVAFVGDQGTGEHARAVLQLVRDEGTDLLVLGGDLGYDASPGDWGSMMDDLLGASFPVLSAAGNHDRHEWPEYESWLQARIDAVDGLACSGAVGVKARCTYRGLSIVQTAPGVQDVSDVGLDDDYTGFIDATFKDDPAQWRICSFHKNMQDMQAGGKSDATGWGVYEACRRAGAMVATGHEHSYSRTYLMDEFEGLDVAHRNSRLVLEEGRSFAFVSGLGGYEVRDQERDGDWWASIFAEQQGADHGALFCRFDGDVAECEFKSVTGAVPDRFTLQTRVGSASALPSASVEVADVQSAAQIAEPQVQSNEASEQLAAVAEPSIAQATFAAASVDEEAVVADPADETSISNESVDPLDADAAAAADTSAADPIADDSSADDSIDAAQDASGDLSSTAGTSVDETQAVGVGGVGVALLLSLASAASWRRRRRAA